MTTLGFKKEKNKFKKNIVKQNLRFGNKERHALKKEKILDTLSGQRQCTLLSDFQLVYMTGAQPENFLIYKFSCGRGLGIYQNGVLLGGLEVGHIFVMIEILSGNFVLVKVQCFYCARLLTSRLVRPFVDSGGLLILLGCNYHC